MLIPKLNKFQAIPKKKYRVISEASNLRKTFSLKTWREENKPRELENQHSMVFKNKMRKLWNNLCKLWRTRSFSLVSDTISLPQRYNKKINYHTRVSFFTKKNKKILSHLNTVAFTAIKQVSAIWCKLFISINEKPLLYVLKLSSLTLHMIQLKPLCHQINKNSQ